MRFLLGGIKGKIMIRKVSLREVPGVSVKTDSGDIKVQKITASSTHTKPAMRLSSSVGAESDDRS
jgi:hypothetical protein